MKHTCNELLEWPCTYVGAEEFFGLDLLEYLEGDTLISVAWDLPNGLVSVTEVVIGSISYIKINSEFAGQHKIKFNIRSSEVGGAIQTLPGFVYLHVEDYQ